MKRTPAFTLIELLIVVAIIAILAAIAVPNFLEAQTRSKISRVKSDQRTIATAIESYLVDNNHPALDYVDWQYYHNSAHNARNACYRQFTTPIAYITSVPLDPFGLNRDMWTPGGTRRFDELKNYHYEQYRKSWNAAFTPALTRGYVWSLYSPGPIGYDEQPWIFEALGHPNTPVGGRHPMSTIYDSTNGTISYGRIGRTNKGVMEDVN